MRLMRRDNEPLLGAPSAGLMRLSQAQRQAAFRAVYDRLQLRALAMASKYFDQDAEDVVQDAFLTLWICCFEDGDVDVEVDDGLLFKILRDVMVDRLRKRVAEKRRNHNPALRLHLSSRIANTTDTSRVAEASDLLPRLNYIVETLPEPRRSVFRKAYENGWNVREVAHQMDLKYNTARWHLAAALEVVRQTLERDGYAVPRSLRRGRRGRGGSSA